MRYPWEQEQNPDLKWSPPLLKTIEGHKDCINSVAFHPHGLPILATGSGQRLFNIQDEDDADSSEYQRDSRLQMWFIESSVVPIK